MQAPAKPTACRPGVWLAHIRNRAADNRKEDRTANGSLPPDGSEARARIDAHSTMTVSASVDMLGRLWSLDNAKRG
jgi:hypothetical protein